MEQKMDYSEFEELVTVDDKGTMWRYTIMTPQGVEYFSPMYTHTVDKEHYKKWFFTEVNKSLEKLVKKAYDEDVKANNG
jgi:hypothetical protein